MDDGSCVSGGESLTQCEEYHNEDSYKYRKYSAHTCKYKQEISLSKKCRKKSSPNFPTKTVQIFDILVNNQRDSHEITVTDGRGKGLEEK